MRTTYFLLVSFLAILSTTVVSTAEAGPSSIPLLAKRSTSISPSGRVRSMNCMIHPDGVVIERDFDGVITREEKNLAVSGDIDSKIADAASAKLEVTQNGPMEFSYSLVAFWVSPTAGKETVTLGAFDGATGEQTFNPSPSAVVLRDLLNSICNN